MLVVKRRLNQSIKIGPVDISVIEVKKEYATVKIGKAILNIGLEPVELGYGIRVSCRKNRSTQARFVIRCPYKLKIEWSK